MRRGTFVLTSSRNVVLGAALRTGNLAANAVVSLLMMPFVVRTIGDRMYGTFVLVGAFVGYYGLVDLGLSSAVTRHLSAAIGAQEYEHCNRVYNTSLRLFTGLGVVVLALSCGFALAASKFSKTPADAAIFWKLVLILGFSLALDFPSKVYSGFLYAYLHIHLLAALDLLSLALRTVLIIAVLLRGHGVVAMAIVTLLSTLPAKIWPAIYAHKKLPFLRYGSSYWDRTTAKSLFSYGALSFISRVADLLRFQVDAPVVAGFVGLAAVTHYKIAGTLVQYFVQIMRAANEGFPSIFSRQEGAKNYEALRRTFFFGSKICTCVAAFIGFGLIAWGRPFIARWMGQRYLDAYPCLVVLAVGWTFGLAQSPSVQLLFGISKHKFFAWFNSVEGGANLVLSILLARRYGILGVALGTMIPMLVTKLIIQPIYVCKVAGIPYFEYVRRMSRTLGTIAVAVLIPLILTIKFAAPNYKALAVLAAVSALVYTLVLWFLEFTPAEVKILERAILPKATRLSGD
jgi:O-antigen/teichoic acid export membrane protein